MHLLIAIILCRFIFFSKYLCKIFRYLFPGSADAVLSLVNAGSAVEAEDKDGLTGWL